MFVLSQISGIIALILICISYFCKRKSVFLILQTIADLFYGGAYLLLNHYVAGLITMVSTIRCIYLYIAENKQFKYTEHFLSVFILSYIIIGVGCFESYLDIIPIITATIYTIAFVIKNMQTVRYVCIVPNVMLLAYSTICTTYTNAMLDFLEIIVLIASIIKYGKRKYKPIIY